MIKFDQITKIYRGGTVAVKKLNLEVKAGQLIVLVGPSGCGKTTTLKMVNRLIEPSSGNIYIHNQRIQSFDVVELRRNIGCDSNHRVVAPSYGSS